MNKITLTIFALLIMVSLALGDIGEPRYTGPEKIRINPEYPQTDDDTLLLHFDFEDGMGDWTTEDLTVQTNHWNPDPYNAYEGNSWWCGDTNVVGSGYNGYDNFWLQYMDTPEIDLTAATAPSLTFQVYWSVESPASATTPYDGWDGCNVWISTNGGLDFTPILPVTPAYTCNSLSSFGSVYGLGPNIPGWADQSTTWRPAEFNLASYIGRNVIIRIAFCSDRAVASSTGHPELIGFFVDDVQVADGANVLFLDNGDDPPVGGDFTFEQGLPFGDHWEMTTTSSFSPTHSMRVDDDNFYINNALITPSMELLDDFTLWFEYAVRCDMPDTTHGTSTALRDYYFVDLSDDDGETWTNLFYDYARGYCYPNWGICGIDTPYAGQMSTEISQWAGETVKLRFRCVTDGDHTTGNGQGLFIDDLWIFGNNVPGDDVGASDLYIPFPNTVGYQLDCSVQINNYGLNNQPMIATFFIAGSYIMPIAPFPSVPPESSVQRTFTWSPTVAGEVEPYVYSTITGDVNHFNDTTFAGTVEVLNTDDYELGYDNRNPEFYYNFALGTGPLVKFIVPENIAEMNELHIVRAMFNGQSSSVNFMLHVYDEGTPTTPGDELYSTEVTVDPANTYPNWWSVGYPYGPGLSATGEFWVWFEMTDPGGLPNPVGHDRKWGQGHYFSYNGTNASEYADDLMIRGIVGEIAIHVEEENITPPSEFALKSIYPNPFNPSTEISYSLAENGQVQLAVYDVAGKKVTDLFSGFKTAGNYTYNFDGRNLASGVYFLRLKSKNNSACKKMLLIK